MQPTHPELTQVSPTTTARTLRDAATYLSRHGWIQGAYYDPAAEVFTPAACTVGAIGMVCYGGPVEAPAQMFDHSGFDEFEAAVSYLDRLLADEMGHGVYEWNDDRARTWADVVETLVEAADLCEGACPVDGAR
jgi:hypothetical protein